uniref:Acetyltransferase n=1 Tax=Panagrellus redivivus TaxID=6233 RepID=A0A7E4W5U4_PANRE
MITFARRREKQPHLTGTMTWLFMEKRLCQKGGRHKLGAQVAKESQKTGLMTVVIERNKQVLCFNGCKK